MAKIPFILINLRFLTQPHKKFLTLLKQSYNSVVMVSYKVWFLDFIVQCKMIQ